MKNFITLVLILLALDILSQLASMVFGPWAPTRGSHAISVLCDAALFACGVYVLAKG